MTPRDSPAKNPRITCVATHAGQAGGAAIAMERLAAGLRGAGARVDMVTRAASAWPPAVRHLDRRIRRRIRHGRTLLSNTLFTADWPAWDVAGHPAVANCDLVNIHWVAGFLGAEGIRRIVRSGRPVAWTLHDMRGFTGGCHYAAGCEGFTAGCTACPQLTPQLTYLPARTLSRARRRLRGLPLTFVTPSRWLAGELTRSSLFDPVSHDVRVIPNGIDLGRFAPGDRTQARERLGLPADGFTILLGSISLEERRKGGAVAVEAIRRMVASLAGDRSAQPAPVVVTYGSGPPPIPGVACRHLGTVTEQGVREALHACDIHLTMAREDNLPNTVMEALACGVPVLAARAGGLPEMVDDGVTGWLVEVDDTEHAAALLTELVRDPSRAALAGRQGRRQAESEWDVAVQASRYLDLARELNLRGTSHLGTGSTRSIAAKSAGIHAVSPALITPAVAVIAHPAQPLRGPLRRVRRLTSRSSKRAS